MLKNNQQGKAVFIPFQDNPVDLKKLMAQAVALMKSERKRNDLTSNRFNWGWGTLAIAVNPKSLDQNNKKHSQLKTLLEFWSKQYGNGFEPNQYKVGEELPSVDKQGVLAFEWPDELKEYDFLIATATKPEREAYPTAKNIAARMLANNYSEYFDKNVAAGIVTFQDAEILKLLKSKPSEKHLSITAMTDEFLFNEYFKEKQKHKFIEEIPDSEKATIASVIMTLSYSEHEDEATHNDTFHQLVDKLKQAKEDVTALQELIQIFEENKQNKIAELEGHQESLFQKIMGDASSQYKYLLQQGTEEKKAVAEQLKKGRFENKANKESVNRYQVLQKIIDSVRFPSIVLTAELLKAKAGDNEDELILGLASVIENPGRMSFHNAELEAEWKTFPLKWYSHRFTLPQIRYYFKLHKEGRSLDSFIEQYVSKHLKEITTKFDNHFYPAFAQRSILAHNAVHCFEQELYASSICTSLPLIEGSLWAFADYYDFVHHTLFTKENGIKHLLLSNGNKSKDYTVGDLLKRSALVDFFDENFIHYYCDELYNERNPILHGQETKGFTRINAAKKLLTFDYLTDQMNAFIKEQYFQSINELLGERIVNKLLNKEPLNDDDRNEMNKKVQAKQGIVFG